MEDNFFIERLFMPLKLDNPVSEADYVNIQPCIDSLFALARIANMSIYVKDYYRGDFLYVSYNPLFLCGYERDEVKKLGNDFYLKVVVPEDLEMLSEVIKKGFEYYYGKLPEIKDNFFISCDFRVRHLNKQVIMLNHKLTPFAFTSTGEIWLALCLVTLSTRKKPGNIYIQQLNSSERFDYSFVSKRWKSAQSIKLTEREKEVLRLSAQGYTIKEIADKLYVEVTTVKYHKTTLCSKLGVDNATEAVYFASANHLI